MAPARTDTVLIIEPDRAVQAHLCAALEADGHRAIATDSVGAGLRALAAFHIDLILIAGDSVSAPGDWDLLLSLRAAASPIPVVILSSAGAVPFAGYRSRGFAGLIAKPIDADDFSTALRPILRAAHRPTVVAATLRGAA